MIYFMKITSSTAPCGVVPGLIPVLTAPLCPSIGWTERPSHTAAHCETHSLLLYPGIRISQDMFRWTPDSHHSPVLLAWSLTSHLLPSSGESVKIQFSSGIETLVGSFEWGFFFFTKGKWAITEISCCIHISAIIIWPIIISVHTYY